MSSGPTSAACSTCAPRFARGLALSISYRDQGVSFEKARGADSTLILPKDLPSVPLDPQKAKANSPEADPSWWTAMRPSSQIKKFDFCFRSLPSLPTPPRSLEDLKARLPSFGTVSHSLESFLEAT